MNGLDQQPRYRMIGVLTADDMKPKTWVGEWQPFEWRADPAVTHSEAARTRSSIQSEVDRRLVEFKAMTGHPPTNARLTFSVETRVVSTWTRRTRVVKAEVFL